MNDLATFYAPVGAMLFLALLVITRPFENLLNGWFDEVDGLFRRRP